MKSVVAVLALLLAGCATPVPVRQVWPQVPQPLMEPCPPLKQMQTDRPGLKDLLLTVIDNYAVYYRCADRAHTWQEWYREQQKIFEEVNKK